MLLLSLTLWLRFSAEHTQGTDYTTFIFRHGCFEMSNMAFFCFVLFCLIPAWPERRDYGTRWTLRSYKIAVFDVMTWRGDEAWRARDGHLGAEMPTMVANVRKWAEDSVKWAKCDGFHHIGHFTLDPFGCTSSGLVSKRMKPTETPTFRTTALWIAKWNLGACTYNIGSHVRKHFGFQQQL